MKIPPSIRDSPDRLRHACPHDAPGAGCRRTSCSGAGRSPGGPSDSVQVVSRLSRALSNCAIPLAPRNRATDWAGICVAGPGRRHVAAAVAAAETPLRRPDPARIVVGVPLPSPVSTVTSAARTELPAVEVADLRKEFRRKAPKGSAGPRTRRVAAIDGLSFTMARGETIAILGKNGSGKSTLVRILSTLLLHDGGEARVFGHDVGTEARAVRRLVNRVSVEASFFKKMSAAENLGYAARFYGMTARRTREEIPRILSRVGFPPDRRGEPMEALSRGMQQKVALARALLTSPVLLLLDEPTTGLDPRSKQEVQEFIREIRTLHDSTILLCTHDMKEAEDLADRIGLLDRGRLLFLEPAEDVKARYGVETLEEAFFAATGRTFEDEKTQEDEEREVFA